MLYLDVRPGEGLQRLQALAAATRAHFDAAGLLLQADRPFVPHVTIAKTSKLQGGWGGKRGRGGHGHGHGRPHGGQGSQGQRGNEWEAERRAERQAKQQRLELEAAGEEEAAGMEWGPPAHAAEAAEVARAECATEAAAGPSGSSSPAAASAAPPGSSAAQQASDSAAATEVATTDPSAAADTSGQQAADAQQEEGEAEEGGEEAVLPWGADVSGEQARHAALPHRHRDRVRRERGHGGQGLAEQQQGQRRAQPSWRQIDAEAWAPLVAIEGGRALLTEVQLVRREGLLHGGPVVP